MIKFAPADSFVKIPSFTTHLLFSLDGFHPAKSVPLNSLWIFIILGIVLGLLGSCSNFLILKTRSLLQTFYNNNKYSFVLTGAVLAGISGLLYSFRSELAGDGFNVIPKVIEGFYGLYPLFLMRGLVF